MFETHTNATEKQSKSGLGRAVPGRYGQDFVDGSEVFWWHARLFPVTGNLTVKECSFTLVLSVFL